ncbi:hypothetical protein GCM10010145_06720 [Streptomyces ruber]|uniref:DUF4245 domain-containing protein n=3 Tax=Streptomyces TaxID=1883 RepID=A0A918B9N3_9ACTN|nr:hypothetical protein GCM10010145_06720 [Streptomyces ruber]
MKGKQTVRDMVLSLGLICLAAGVIYFFVPHEDKEPDLRRVDYSVELQTARRAASYPVAAPEGLPESWKPTSVRFLADQSDAWHLGYHDPDGRYVSVQQSAEKPSGFIEDATQGAEDTGKTEEIDGRTWHRYEGERYDALVLPGEGSTTVVAGSAPYAQLMKMAEALRTE